MKLATLFFRLALFAWIFSWGNPGSAKPKNVIFLIGDGMGFEQVIAGGMFLNGQAGTLSFESLPNTGEVMTASANSAITDSAAAATAMATGQKVDNNVISMAIPGDGSELTTLLEIYAAQGRSTGLVTTTYMTHATPACFGAHEQHRDRLNQIADDYLVQTQPNILFGGGANGMNPQDAMAAGYTLVTDAVQLAELDTATETFVSGQFGSSHLPYELDGLGSLPHLSDMTATALDILDNDPDGFFLMVEGGRIDHAGHDNRIDRAVREVVEFHNAAQVAIDWAAGRTDTLILVTADHETGGLAVLANNGAGNEPTVTWSTTGHTGVNVPIYGWGVNAELIEPVMDNTALFELVLTDTRSPDNGELDVDINAPLWWQAAADPDTTYNVYFGPIDPENPAPPLVSTGQPETVYDPGTLLPNTEYSWTYGEVETASGQEVFQAPVWNFFTAHAPEPASAPNPSDGAMNISPATTLAWTPGQYTTAHEVYLDTVNPPEQGPGPGNPQSQASYNPPGFLDCDTPYYWRIDEIGPGGRTEGLVWTFTTGCEFDHVAISESSVSGTVTGGDYTATHASDNGYEAIQETQTGGGPLKNRRSILEHKWTIDVDGGTSATFYLEAHHTPNDEGDDFIFAYSTDDASYSDMFTVTKTADDNNDQLFTFPPGVEGTIFIRATDTNRDKGKAQMDTLYVDNMFVRTSFAQIPPGPATNPDPTDGATGIGLEAELSWTAGTGATKHDVYFGEDSGNLPRVSTGQSGTNYDPGSLALNTTYYWRIDEVGQYGTTPGDEWSFTTESCDPTQAMVSSVVTGTIKGTKGRSYGTATVTIVDSSGNPVADYGVSGRFTGDFQDDPGNPHSGTTNASGIVVLQTTDQVRNPSFDFEVICPPS